MTHTAIWAPLQGSQHRRPFAEAKTVTYAESPVHTMLRARPDIPMISPVVSTSTR